MKIIVLDTNIWRSELALMTPTGCAFSHYVTISGFKIGLPEVVEEETKYIFRKELLDWRSKTKENYERMLAIFGKLKELSMPLDEDIERKVEAIFDFHQDRIIRVTFDLECARSSFDKIIKKEPPNSEHNQQFKDGVIWANCLELAKSNDVFFVTDDKGFFRERDYKKGLAENLSLEEQNLPNKISIFSNLADLIEEIKSDLKLDEDKLIKLIEKETDHGILKLSEPCGYDVQNILNKRFEVFATINPKEVAVKFFIKYDLENKSTDQRVNSYAESKGEFLLNIENYNIRNFINQGENLFWTNEDGEPKQTHNYYGYLNSVLGHKTIEHQIFYKLGER